MTLYALCDQATLERENVSVEAFVELCRRHGAEVLQYRNKSSDIAFIKSRLIELRRLWDGFLIVNDRYELAAFCDGVHIGQEDMKAIDSDPRRAVRVLREVIGGDKILGLSTHDESEIRTANALDLNYIGLGAYRSSGTKEVDRILGDRLDALAALSEYPVAAIGGVRLDDAFEHVAYRVVGSALYER